MGADAIRCEGLSRGTFSRGRALMRIDRRRFLRTMAILGVVFAYATIVLVGVVTITSENDPAIVTLHLALGTATLAAALIVAMVSLWPPSAASAALDR